jgi:elongation factor G
MPNYTTENIRNITLIGHNGAGKTSLLEAILFKSDATRRLGSVNDKTSHLDYSDEEKEKGCSFESAVCHVDHNDHRINIVDTPGLPAFNGQAIPALAAADVAVCVIAAKDGVQVNTRKMMVRAAESGLPRMIVVNKIDGESINFEELYAQIRETFGSECVCANLPTAGATAVVKCFDNESGDADFSDLATMHEQLVEAIVGVDDTLMEKYLGGELDKSELSNAAKLAVIEGCLVPIVFTNALDDVGITEFLDALCRFCPNPAAAKPRELVDGETTTPLTPDPNAEFVGVVFKIMNDPKSNIKYSAIRCLQGTLKTDGAVHIARESKGMKPGHLHSFQAAEHTEIDSGIPGDIIGLAKLDLRVGDTVTGGMEGTVKMPETPVPMFSMAISPKARGDGDKISAALSKYTDEDPCFRAERDAATGELVIAGMGELHLRTMLQRMHRYFKLEVDTRPPRIPYRETMTKPVKEVEYTHKKQSGGAGQFGRVIITVEPTERSHGYEFVDEIFGGSIDQQFRPSVDKGVRKQMALGVLAGYPVVDVRVKLVDGKTHPVDSKDIAFQIAGQQAFKDAFLKGSPILLEPIVTMEVTVPGDNVGDIQGDLASRRGRPLGQDMLPGGYTMIKAQVPLAEIANYSSSLSSISGGQGSYSMELSHYDPVPSNVQQQVIDKAKKEKEEASA